MRIAHLVLLGAASLTLQGCLAKTAFDVATAPVRIVSKGVDLATTSQSEADEKRGRELRKREERVGKLDRRYRKQRKDCLDGERGACDDARRTYEEMQVLVRSLPAESADGED